MQSFLFTNWLLVLKFVLKHLFHLIFQFMKTSLLHNEYSSQRYLRKLFQSHQYYFNPFNYQLKLNWLTLPSFSYPSLGFFSLRSQTRADTKNQRRNSADFFLRDLSIFFLFQTGKWWVPLNEGDKLRLSPTRPALTEFARASIKTHMRIHDSTPNAIGEMHYLVFKTPPTRTVWNS